MGRVDGTERVERRGAMLMDVDEMGVGRCGCCGCVLAVMEGWTRKSGGQNVWAVDTCCRIVCGPIHGLEGISTTGPVGGPVGGLQIRMNQTFVPPLSLIQLSPPLQNNKYKHVTATKIRNVEVVSSPSKPSKF